MGNIFEAAFGQAATWDPMEGRKASRVYLFSGTTEPADRTHWPAMTDWLICTLRPFPTP